MTDRLEDLRKMYIGWTDESPKVVNTEALPHFVVDVVDVDGNWLRDIPVPTGLDDPIHFAVGLLAKHAPEVIVIFAERETTSGNPLVVVADAASH